MANIKDDRKNVCGILTWLTFQMAPKVCEILTRLTLKRNPIS